MDRNIDSVRFFNVLLDVYMSIEYDSFLITLGVVQLDVYFLLRLFITFDEKKMERGPSGCQNSRYRQIKNAIFYGGAGHVDIYKDFFHRFFGKSPSISTVSQTNTKCLTFDEPFDFFGGQ